MQIIAPTKYIHSKLVQHSVLVKLLSQQPRYQIV